MKKMILLAAFTFAGLVNAKRTETKEVKGEAVKNNVIKTFYFPIKVTSSCEYTEYIDVAGSDISCIEVEIDRMEMECDAPVTGWGYA